MFVEVAVFGFTLRSGTYTYQADPGLDIVPGQVVKIPFGKNSRSGIVLTVNTSPPEGLSIKEVGEVASASPVVTPEQLKLARLISETYFISQADSLELMLPRLPKVELRQGQRKQKLYLFPTLRQAEAAARGKLVFTHAAKAKEFDLIWQEVASGETSEIFGTRSALFAPFQKLTEVNIFQTESDLYKEERRPYYRSLEVARLLAKIHGAKINPVSYSPRVVDNYQIPHEIRRVESNFNYRIVDLKRGSLVNSDLKAFVSKPGRVLVFLNRKTESGPLVCRTCKVRSFTADPSVCPNCGGSDVKFQLFNLRTAAEELRESNPQGVFATQQIFFQDQAPFERIAVLSADTYLSHGSYLATERTFQLVTSLLRLLKPGGEILVQTAFPDLSCIQNALQVDYHAFYQDELKGRRETGYPPFSQLARLSFSGKELPEFRPPGDLEIFGPFADKKTQYFIVRGQDLAPLSELGRAWKLDIDPVNL